MSLWLLPNVGAEEPPPKSPAAPLARVADLFCLLFPAAARRLDAPEAEISWPDALGERSEGAAYPWLEDANGVRAWLNTEDAVCAAQRAGEPLLGPAPDVVARVHDKAFAWRVCRDTGFEARSLHGLTRVFEPDDLADAEATLTTLRETLAGWPDWTGQRFTLKPRRGGAGRGRVGGDPDRLEEVSGALPRLARQGGALLEPWLERETDLSAQLRVADDGTLTLLASFEQHVSASGVYRGHRGRLDHRLRVTSGSAYESEFLEAASEVARAAYAEGFRGPCGVDAFSFRGPRGLELRPVVELNARFTMGTLLAGLLRRARASIQAAVPASPGETRRFEFALETPPDWPASSPPDRWLAPLGPPAGTPQPALRVTRA